MNSFQRSDVPSLVALSLILLVFVLTSLTTSFVVTKRAYSSGEPASDWLLVGGLTSTNANFRVFRSSSAAAAAAAAASAFSSNETVTLVVSPNQDLSEPVLERVLSAAVAQDDDVAVEAISADNNLEPETRYFYAVVNDDGERSLPGSFQTPAAEGQPFNFTIAAAGCSYTGSRHAVFDEIAKEEALIFFHLGDFHYEDISENDMEKRMDAIGMTLASSEIANLYRSTALVSMWDDHDYMGSANGFDEKEEGARDTALRSYQKAFPHYPLALEGDAVSPYHAFTIGTVRFVVTDQLSEAANGARLSEEQTAWFKEELSQAENFDFIVWISSKPWIGDQGSSLDREELSEFISQTIGGADGPQNLIVVAADAHMVAFDDGTNTYYGNDEMALSFPILQSGPLDRMGNVKGGPFTDGCHATDLERNHQYSTISFEVPAGGGGEPCMEIRSYRVDTAKEEILPRKLCGRIFEPSAKGVREGTCEIKNFSKNNNILFGFAIANTFVATVVVCFSSRLWRSLAISALVWIGLIASLAVGAAVPLLKGLPDLNMLPINIILFVQSVVIGLFTTICCYQSSSKQDYTNDTLSEKEEPRTPETTVHGFDEDSDLWLREDVTPKGDTELGI